MGDVGNQPEGGQSGPDGPPGTLAEALALAERIADQLRAEGLPILGSTIQDAGYKAAFAISLPDGRRTAFRVPVENLSLESVRQMVEAYL